MVHIMFQEMESRKNIVHVLSVVVQVSGVDSDPMASRLHWQTGRHGAADLSGPRGEKKP